MEWGEGDVLELESENLERLGMTLTQQIVDICLSKVRYSIFTRRFLMARS